MSLFASLLAAVTIAYPRPNAQLPFVERCYFIGAVDKGVTEIEVAGHPVDVYRTGAWGTLVEVTEGTNVIALTGVDRSGAVWATNVTLTVAARPAPPPAGASAPPPKVYEKLPYAADEPQGVPTNRAPGEIVVWLDPGHGGSDTGALSPHGFAEKEANLLTALAVRDELRARGFQVFMTRERDVALELTERPRAAHEAKADAFVSIHHNAPGIASDPVATRYASVYSWNPLGERLSQTVAAHLGAALASELDSHGSLHANFAVTRSPQVPSCLVEVDFISSPAGEEAIWSSPRRSLVARAIADGIAAWCRGED